MTSIEASDETFDEIVAAESGTVLVEFWAQWCGPCRMLSPILEAIALDHPGKLSVVKVNVDENPVTAARFQVMAVPAMKVLRDGDVVKSILGAKPRPALEHELGVLLVG